jgi:acyl-CoA reductase-like NAD-dependent aldehyde dehydrogenase
MEKLIKDLYLELKKEKTNLITKVNLDSNIEKSDLEKEFEDSLLALKGLPIQTNKLLQPEKVFVPNYSKKAIISRIPKGKVLQILPATTPLLSCILLPLCAAIMGNEVIVKPSSKSKSIALFLERFFKKENVKNINFEIGSGKNFLFKVLKDNYDFVFFMGSEKNGKEINEYCHKREIEYLGEYGGNDWAIIIDGDLKSISNKIAENVKFKEGRDCDSIKGVLINSKVYEPFVDLLKINLKDIKIKENPSDKEIANPGFCSSLWIKKFSSEEEIFSLYKKNKHGLSSAIFYKDTKKALELAKKINIARVIINSDTLDINPLIPWGGIKLTSRGGVEYWINKFSNKKLIEIS